MRALQEYVVSRSTPEPTSGCWLWTHACDSSGYGAGRHSQTGRAQVGAHRLSFAAFVGPIPAGLQVCHRCDNPPCVNPNHLFLGTRNDNMRDMGAKGRSSRSRLTPAEVSKMRDLRAQGATQLDLARAFGVQRNTVSYIVRGLHWRSL